MRISHTKAMGINGCDDDEGGLFLRRKQGREEALRRRLARSGSGLAPLVDEVANRACVCVRFETMVRDTSICEICT